MRYIMVTNWENHWDNLSNNRTSYSGLMLRDGMTQQKILENTPTIFIKRKKKSNVIQKAWDGFVSDFNFQKPSAISFKVTLSNTINLPAKYNNYKEGWYIEEQIDPNILQPIFFNTLLTTKDWKEFEDYTYYLLRLLGIHETYRYETQKGQADGFFILKNLAVIYDCTLEQNFEVTKAQQIQNYCLQLNDGKIQHKDSTWNVSACQKQVWIITRGAFRRIQEIDNIPIKEVPISSLIQVYNTRLIQAFNEEKLENYLRNLAQ